ncbi:acyl-CoA N-acyltransferase [Dichomitus squalens]|uniref:Acyl-CoA N-acyltransferase n=1 Tax=Dichomitus squalens TaxID=114155 RepID=A0A4Q9P5F3_9APHY|nr:acyl-CoA N-acyltransferase [Dichomitus squalens]TBU64509.1 acyl-CoA N-acyltransferase [Dichomitus squalens]
MTDPNFYIESPRLYLSYFQPALDTHCDFLVELWNSPEFIRDATGGAGTSIKDREAARTRLATFAAAHERNGYGIFLVSLKPADAAPADADADVPFQEKLARAKLIGTVSLLRGTSPTAYKAPDLGFAILPEEMRKGYAREAAQTLLAWAKRERGVDVALGFTGPKNAGSNGLFRSLGFQDCGVHTLVEFGGDEAAVWVSPGAHTDLSVYGI